MPAILRWPDTSRRERQGHASPDGNVGSIPVGDQGGSDHDEYATQVPQRLNNEKAVTGGRHWRDRHRLPWLPTLLHADTVGLFWWSSAALRIFAA
jgi:hypothetical protein